MKIGILLSDDELKRRIIKRLRARVRQGMVAEVKKLHAQGLSWQRLDDFGLEYRYVSRYLRGMLTKEKLVEKLETEIWRYAKRQITWWKRDKKIIWTKTNSETICAVNKFLLGGKKKDPK